MVAARAHRQHCTSAVLMAEAGKGCPCRTADHAVNLQAKAGLERSDGDLCLWPEMGIDGAERVTEAIEGSLKSSHIRSIHAVPQNPGTTYERIPWTLPHIIPARSNE